MNSPSFPVASTWLLHALLATSLGCTTRAEDRPDAAREPHTRAPAAESAGRPNADAAALPGAANASPAPCPEGMAYIAGGTFTMGLSPGGLKEMPMYARWNAPHQVTITKPYCIDRTEVPAGAYRKCVAAGACPRNHCNAQFDELVEHPMNCVNWNEADGYCRWASKRLPTEAEWEFAAKGPRSFRHPWGNSKPDDTKLWWSGTKTQPASARATSRTDNPPRSRLSAEGSTNV